MTETTIHLVVGWGCLMLALGLVGGWQWRGVIQQKKIVITIHAHDCMGPFTAVVSDDTAPSTTGEHDA